MIFLNKCLKPKTNMNVCVTNLYSEPTNKNCDDELWKKIYNLNKQKFDSYIQNSHYPIIIIDNNGNIKEFNKSTFLQESFVPPELKTFINNMYNNDIEAYLNTVSHLGTKIIFVNYQYNRVNIRFYKT